MRKIAYILTSLILISCVKETEDRFGAELSEHRVPITVEVSHTKTLINGNQISFDGNESMNLVCKDINVAKLYNKGFDLNTFTGEFLSVGQTKDNASWYAVYPYVGIEQQGYGDCWLPMNQTAPFDAAANFMCSDLVDADYDETAMPKLSMTMNQLLGIMKVSFTNSSEDYKEDLIQEVVMTSSTPLCGNFIVKFDEQGKPFPEFKGGTCRVLSSYPAPIALGVNEIHSVYMFVNPAEIKDAQITIRTDRHVFTRKAKSSFKVRQGDLTFMDPMDVADLFAVDDAKVKKIVIWGDRYSNCGPTDTYLNKRNYSYHLQQLLGSGWKIYNCAYPDYKTYNITALQGSTEMRLGNHEFTIPISVTPVGSGGVYVLASNRYTSSESMMPHAFLNPCEIVVRDDSGKETARVEGNLERQSDGTFFTRSRPGEEVFVPRKSQVVPYAAKNLRKPDLTIIYMGYNGGFSDLETLYNQHRSMIEYAAADGPEEYIVLGFHSQNDVSRLNLGQAYWDLFDGPDGFGVNPEAGRPISRFINLYKEMTGEHYKELLYRSGAASDPAGIKAEDIDRANRGEVPASFLNSSGLLMPSQYGAKAFALLIYDRMVELGYLD